MSMYVFVSNITIYTGTYEANMNYLAL